MTLDRRAERFLRMLAASGGGGGYADVAERRRSLEDLVAATQGEPPEGVEARDIAGPIPLRLFCSADTGARAPPAMVFMHGGGWVAGGLATHDAFCRRLARASGCAVILVDYRLAPEHPFPAGLEDCLAAVAWVSRNAAALGVDPARLGVAGDSAGGGLAAAVCVQARDRGGPPIALQLLICPILDIAGTSASRNRLAEGYFLDAATLERDLTLYCRAGVDRADPRLSPLRTANLAGLPPALIHSAEYDPFTDEGETFARRLQEAGATARFERHPGMIHFFYAMPLAIPYATAAIAAMGAEVRSAMAA